MRPTASSTAVGKTVATGRCRESISDVVSAFRRTVTDVGSGLSRTVTDVGSGFSRTLTESSPSRIGAIPMTLVGAIVILVGAIRLSIVGAISADVVSAFRRTSRVGVGIVFACVATGCSFPGGSQAAETAHRSLHRGMNLREIVQLAEAAADRPDGWSLRLANCESSQRVFGIRYSTTVSKYIVEESQESSSFRVDSQQTTANQLLDRLGVPPLSACRSVSIAFAEWAIDLGLGDAGNLRGISEPRVFD